MLCHTCLPCVGVLNTLIHLLWGWGCPTQLSGTVAVFAGSCCIPGVRFGLLVNDTALGEEKPLC